MGGPLRSDGYREWMRRCIRQLIPMKFIKLHKNLIHILKFCDEALQAGMNGMNYAVSYLAGTRMFGELRRSNVENRMFGQLCVSHPLIRER